MTQTLQANQAPSSNHTHQTQCPNCQHRFSVTDQQLALKSGFARCSNCHKIFSAIDYLFDAPAMQYQPNPTAAASPSRSTAASIPSQTNRNDLDDTKLLFDDHSGLDEDGEPVYETSAQAYKANSANRRKNNTHSSQPAGGDFDIIDNFDSLPVTANVGFNTPPAPKNQEDEAWLNALLADDKQQSIVHNPLDSKLTQRHSDKNDVSSLLDELGVDVTEEQALSDDEYVQRVNARFQNQISSQKHIKTTSPGMTAIWTIGSILLTGLLVAQYLAFNAENMLKDPNRASTITSICRSLPINCNLPMADIALIDTNILSLEPSKGDAKKTDMVFTLKNTASTPNLYPNLKVTLRSGNLTKAQFVVPTVQYIDKDSSRLVGGQIKPIKLRIDYPSDQFDQANIDLFY